MRASDDDGCQTVARASRDMFGSEDDGIYTYMVVALPAWVARWRLYRSLPHSHPNFHVKYFSLFIISTVRVRVRRTW